MKVIITGGCGFIGSHVVDHFISKKSKVVIVDSFTHTDNESYYHPCTLYKLDISDRVGFNSLLSGEKPDLVINLAAETHVENSIKDILPFIYSNIIGTTSVSEACLKHKIPLVHISTDKVYGSCCEGSFNENASLNPKNPYSATKAAADQIIQSFHHTQGLEYLIIRPSNNYGPRQYHEKFIPKLLEKLNKKDRFPLYGRGVHTREWTYVEDTASLIYEIVCNGKTEWNGVYNLSSNISLDNTQVINSVINQYNAKHYYRLTFEDVVLSVEDRPGHGIRYAIDSEKLNRLLNPVYTSFEEGIKRIWETK